MPSYQLMLHQAPFALCQYKEPGDLQGDQPRLHVNRLLLVAECHTCREGLEEQSEQVGSQTAEDSRGHC